MDNKEKEVCIENSNDAVKINEVQWRISQLENDLQDAKDESNRWYRKWKDEQVKLKSFITLISTACELTN
jgi:hypothetical protein